MMAAEEKMLFASVLALSFLQCFCLMRFGHPSKTIHLQSEYGEESLNPNTFTVINDERSNDQFSKLAKAESSDILSHAPISHRLRRNSKPENQEPHFNVSVFTLKDSHFQLVVHWAGLDSNVMVFLAKDSDKSRQNGTDVFFSYDYGKTFSNRSSLLTTHDGHPAIINTFFNSLVYNSHYVFTDVVHQYIFTTTDYGESFSRTHLPFIPDVVSLHITNEKVILAMGKSDPEKKLWLSEDFGETWTIMQLHVKSFFWGVKGLDSENVLYIERLEPSGKSSILRYPDFSTNMQNIEVLITDIEDFQIKNKYMFATRRQRLLGSKSKNGTLQLWVSYNRGPFLKAVFPNNKLHTDYYIPDASEDQVFVCVNHENMETNLYISDIRGLAYSLSLERVFYFNPKGAASDTWLSYVTEDSFADFYKIEGLTGVYIASQLQKEFKSDHDLGPEDLVTLITFDKGGHWKPLNPPQTDQYGKRIECSLKENCSLHLSQRFNQLYPPLRTTLIRSQKSAVGVIMASGTLGKSLRGHPAIFLSTDAGYSWHKILDGNYYYSIGDHGGIIAAVKAYWGEGSTNELIYSIDEGESWETLKFSDESIRVYGLMTEPGEKTTTFTLFGSLPNTHQWLIITIDLKPAFKGKKCSPDDYKSWSPSNGLSMEYRHCLLGQEEIYQRRISKKKCYNGQDYERVVSVEKCECRLEDYECDVGYKLDEKSQRFCVHDNSSNIDPYAIPELCKSGSFFNRSRGYRKIPGDLCEEGINNGYTPDKIACPVSSLPEFILFSQRQTIGRISLATETHVELLPILKLKNVIAIEYNYVNNCVYWADIDDDNILSLCLDGKSGPEILVETGLRSIEGLAFDWLTHNLYFVDGENAKISVIRTDINHMGRMRRTILESPTLDKPRGIALHPLKGYLFWTDWGSQPSICRCYMDGTYVKQLITKPDVYWPNGITIDYHTNKIYWVDAKLDYIAMADFDGQNMKHLIQSSSIAPHPFAIGVYKDWIYWDDWIRHSILVADKFDGSGVQVVASNLVGIMDLKIYDRAIQVGHNPCKNANCSHLCLLQPNNKVACMCPDGFQTNKTLPGSGNEKCWCTDGEEMDENGMCHKKSDECPKESFACASGLFCIPSIWHCDGDDDCGDKSDELHCAANTCNSEQFACSNGPCIPKRWQCDMERDCMDGSDETDCKYPACAVTEFACKNGGCINNNWVCDMDDDCRDGSDEENCTSVLKPNCDIGEFRCKSGDKCIHQAWRCDGDKDCHDNSDEEDCSNHTCQSWQFNCSNKHCVFKTWVCDGHDDCKDGSDELNCENHTTIAPAVLPTSETPGNCTPWLFRCQSSGKCIPVWWKCDRVSDCSDGSDEFDCAYTTEMPFYPVTTTPTSPLHNCGENHFTCDNGNCIWQAWVCDGERDCDNGEDEANCTSTCGSDYFHCLHSTGCIPRRYVCNGVKDCADNSDESGCSPTFGPISNISICGPESFECKFGSCIPANKRCDGNHDCLDLSDELYCDGVEREYSLDTLTIDAKSVRKDSLNISWTITKVPDIQFDFMPAISEAGNSTWNNQSWTHEYSYSFKNLNAFTKYHVTVFIRPHNGSRVMHISRPVKYVQQRTSPDVSTPPRNVFLTTIHSQQYAVSWDQPLHPNSHLLGYRLYISPPTPPKKQEILYFHVRNVTLDNFFTPEVNYSIWLTAVGLGMESNKSNIVYLYINKDSVLLPVTNLTVQSYDNFSVVLNWNQSKQQIDGYLVSIFSNVTLTRYETIRAKSSPFNVTGLSPATMYTFKVQAYKGDNQSPPTDIRQLTKGTYLMAPRQLTAHVKEKSTVQLSWELPQDNRQVKWEYGIYYGLNEKDLLDKGIAGKTWNLTYNITDLNSCESYAFVVRLINPYGLGPPTDPVWKTTQFDLKSPPKPPKVTVNGLVATIKWKASCEHINEAIGYKIRINDIIGGKTSWFQLEAAKLTVRVHNVTISHGGYYSVQIQTTHDQARPTKLITFKGPPLPTPNQLRVMQSEDDYQLVWETKHLPSHKFSYVILVSENETDFTKALVFQSNKPKLDLNSLAEARTYYITVRLKDENGYLSEPSAVTSFLKRLEPTSVVLNTTSFVAIVVFVLVIVIALLSALGFLYVRHKRLQRVTLTFANSHYNTRSGATTFSTGDDLGDFVDEEDSPMIRGFSDDEPLVIA